MALVGFFILNGLNKPSRIGKVKNEQATEVEHDRREWGKMYCN